MLLKAQLWLSILCCDGHSAILNKLIARRCKANIGRAAAEPGLWSKKGARRLRVDCRVELCHPCKAILQWHVPFMPMCCRKGISQQICHCKIERYLSRQSHWLPVPDLQRNLLWLLHYLPCIPHCCSWSSNGPQKPIPEDVIGICKLANPSQEKAQIGRTTPLSPSMQWRASKNAWSLICLIHCFDVNERSSV